MADGRLFIGKLAERLRDDVNLQTEIGRTGYVKLSTFTPVDNAYPQICIDVDDGNSEPVFPAGRYRFYIVIWVKKDSQEPYLKLENIKKIVNNLVNRKGTSLSEIDVPSNEGLRVALAVKRGGAKDFDKSTGLYSDVLVYEATISEDESFAVADSGDRPWV